MSNILYRGTSLSGAIKEELGPGVVYGDTFDIFEGRLQDGEASKTVAKQTPVDELNWWTPEGFDGTPYMTDTQSVTGGFSRLIGTAIGFSNGVPIVLYLDESNISASLTPIRYNLGFFDHYDGSFAWVAEEDGEVRDEDGGVVGLTTDSASGPVIWDWGTSLERSARQYEEESELIASTEQVDVSGAIKSVAIMLEGRRTPSQALATFPGYHAGFGDSGENIGRWSEVEVLEELHRKVKERAQMPNLDLVTVNLTTNVMEKVSYLDDTGFDYAYIDGERKPHDETPEYLLGIR